MNMKQVRIIIEGGPYPYYLGRDGSWTPSIWEARKFRAFENADEKLLELAKKGKHCHLLTGTAEQIKRYVDFLRGGVEHDKR